MKILIYEYLTSGAQYALSIDDPLMAEGNNMILALLNDGLELPSQYQLYTIRDHRFPPLSPDFDPIQVALVTSPTHYQQVINKQLADCDAALIIAPESDACLAQQQQRLNDYNILNLGSSVNAIVQATNKYRYPQLLAHSPLKTPETLRAADWLHNPTFYSSGYISKPLDGAGCIQTHYWQTAAQLTDYLQQADISLAHYIIQPYITGNPISISALINGTHCQILSINQQQISQQHHQLHMTGTIVNGASKAFPVALADNITQHLLTQLPGLSGFIGVDIILHQHQPYIIDINPRITSSYIGLAQIMAANPLRLLLQPTMSIAS